MARGKANQALKEDRRIAACIAVGLRQDWQLAKAEVEVATLALAAALAKAKECRAAEIAFREETHRRLGKS